MGFLGFPLFQFLAIFCCGISAALFTNVTCGTCCFVRFIRNLRLWYPVPGVQIVFCTHCISGIWRLGRCVPDLHVRCLHDRHDGGLRCAPFERAHWRSASRCASGCYRAGSSWLHRKCAPGSDRFRKSCLRMWTLKFPPPELPRWP